jgi:hypothetical protein
MLKQIVLALLLVPTTVATLEPATAMTFPHNPD